MASHPYALAKYCIKGQSWWPALVVTTELMAEPRVNAMHGTAVQFGRLISLSAALIGWLDQHSCRLVLRCSEGPRALLPVAATSRHVLENPVLENTSADASNGCPEASPPVSPENSVREADVRSMALAVFDALFRDVHGPEHSWSMTTLAIYRRLLDAVRTEFTFPTPIRGARAIQSSRGLRQLLDVGLAQLAQRAIANVRITPYSRDSVRYWHVTVLSDAGGVISLPEDARQRAARMLRASFPDAAWSCAQCYNVGTGVLTEDTMTVPGTHPNDIS
ncbi:hypothetical protein [Streptomyces sp. NPDC006879]|uniref:hypothetical protein n=1 Tax=Streptomyces sp. NPDC006879 TaxID=3364767 RepID=UPI00369FBFB7